MDNATSGPTAGANTANGVETDTAPIFVPADDDTVEMPPIELYQTTFGVSVCIRALRGSHAEKAKQVLSSAIQDIFKHRDIPIKGHEFEVERLEFGHYHTFGAVDVMCTENESSSISEQLEIILKALKADMPVIVSVAVHTATLMQREATSLADVIGMFFVNMSDEERAKVIMGLPPEVRAEAEELLRDMKGEVTLVEPGSEPSDFAQKPPTS